MDKTDELCSFEFIIGLNLVVKVAIEKKQNVQADEFSEGQVIALNQNKSFQVKLGEDSSVLRLHYLSFIA